MGRKYFLIFFILFFNVQNMSAYPFPINYFTESNYTEIGDYGYYINNTINGEGIGSTIHYFEGSIGTAYGGELTQSFMIDNLNSGLYKIIIDVSNDPIMYGFSTIYNTTIIIDNITVGQQIQENANPFNLDNISLSEGLHTINFISYGTSPTFYGNPDAVLTAILKNIQREFELGDITYNHDLHIFDWSNKSIYDNNTKSDSYVIYYNDIEINNYTYTNISLFVPLTEITIKGYNITYDIYTDPKTYTIPLICENYISNITYVDYMNGDVNYYGSDILGFGDNANLLIFFETPIYDEFISFYINCIDCSSENYVVYDSEIFNVSTLTGDNSYSGDILLSSGILNNGWNIINISNTLQYLSFYSPDTENILSFSSYNTSLKPYIKYGNNICITENISVTPTPTPTPNHRFNGGSDFGVYLFLIVILIISIYLGKL